MLANVIKAYRIKHNLFQKDFAFLVGCSLATLSKIESGKQQAKADLVLNILNAVLPEFGEKLMLLDIEADKTIKDYKPVHNYHNAVKARPKLIDKKIKV
jgi:transcriptional regulator with XRE-family HTH domain